MTRLNLSDYFIILQVKGVKAAEFLQSQLTNDVRLASHEQLQWQAYCTRQGLVQSIFSLWGSEQDYYLLISTELYEITYTLLEKYAIFSKINLKLMTDVAITLEFKQVDEKNINWLIESFTPERLALIWHSEFRNIQDDLTILRAALIDHKFPWLGKQTTNCFRPHEINLPELGVVNFQKGCFPGQEIIARMHYRGKAKQSLNIIYLTTRQAFIPGQKLFLEGNVVGQVVDVVYVDQETLLSVVLQHEVTFSDLYPLPLQ